VAGALVGIAKACFVCGPAVEGGTIRHAPAASKPLLYKRTQTQTQTSLRHARTHARTHARAPKHTHTHTHQTRAEKKKTKQVPLHLVTEW
jgi:hypothetical protein